MPTLVKSSIKYNESEKRLSIIIDDKAKNETCNYNTTPTQVDNIPLVKQTKDECNIKNLEHHTSLPW